MRAPTVAHLLFALLAVLLMAAVPSCKCSSDEVETSAQNGEPRVQEGDAGAAGGAEGTAGVEAAEAVAPQDKKPASIVPAAEAPGASPRLTGDVAEHAAKLVDSFPTRAESSADKRALHLQVDKPMYQLGDTIWVRMWNFDATTLSGLRDAKDDAERDPNNPPHATLTLFAPSGAVMFEDNLEIKGDDFGVSHGFELSSGGVGGVHKLVATLPSGEQVTRSVFVNAFIVPRLQMKLEFERKAYGPGDQVVATFDVKDNEGKPLTNLKVDGIARFGQAEISTGGVTDAAGRVTMKVAVPAGIESEDGVLTALVDYGGAAESTTKRIPLVVGKLNVGLFPEGGELVAGLPSRVYFEARRLSGKPADVEGQVVDADGNVVTSVRSIRDGFGRFAFTPEAGKRYEIRYTKPEGLEATPLPEARAEGCTLRTYDDFDSQERAIRVGVFCTESRDVVVFASLWKNAVDAASVRVEKGAESIVYLAHEDDAINNLQGLAQVTVLDGTTEAPLAERMVYRNRRQLLDIQVTPDKTQYAPRDEVKLTITTKDAAGNPVPAHVAMSVVDDAVVSLADDKTANLLPGVMIGNVEGIEDPNWFFDLSNAEAAAGLDAVVGSRTWRRFTIATETPSSTEATEDTGKPTETQRTATAVPDNAAKPMPPAAPNGQAQPAKASLDGAAVPEEDAKMAGLLGLNKADLAGFDEVAPLGGHGGLGMRGTGKGGGGANVGGLGIGGLSTKGRSGHRGFGRGVGGLGEKRVNVPKLKTGTPNVTGSLDKRIIRKVVHQHKRELKHCYAKEAQKVPDLEGKIVVKWTIDATGNVVAAVETSSTLGNEAISRCITTSIKRWRFPAPKGGGIVVVSYPFVFTDGGGDVGLGGGGFGQPRQFVRVTAPRVWTGVDYSSPESKEGPRTDFRQTVYWAPGVVTDDTGVAQVSFYLSDATTSFRIFAEGVTRKSRGLIGRSETTFASKRPFAMVAKLPTEVSSGDRVDVQVVLENKGIEELSTTIVANTDPLLTLIGDAPKDLVLAPGSSRTVQVSFQVSRDGLQFGAADAVLSLNAVARGSSEGSYSDAVERTILVAPRGFPVTAAVGGMTGDEPTTLDLSQAIPGTLSAELTIEPDSTATMMASMEQMLRRPGGCFEQTSSSNYPNLLVVDFMRGNNMLQPQVEQRALGFLDDGYKRLLTFESPGGGFEWFGKAPGHLTLTAYGIQQFSDMKRVYNGVDQAMVDRTVKWMMDRRDGNGGFTVPQKHLHTWSVSPTYVTAYATLAMVTAGHAEAIAPEVDFQARAIETEQDPYLLALRTMTLLQVPRHAALATDGAKRLAALQVADGSWPNAATTITASGGQDLIVETTAIATRALDRVGGHDSATEKGVHYLLGVRAQQGRFGSTQATVQALQTLAERKPMSSVEGQVNMSFHMDGKEIAARSLDAKGFAPVKLSDMDKVFTAGSKAQVSIVPDKAEARLPWQLLVEHRVVQPPTSPDAPVSLEIDFPTTEVKAGESVRMTAKLTNTRSEAVPMIVARLAFPGGFTTQKWQIEELVEKNTVAFVETRPREVYVYLYGMEAGATAEVPLELKAEIPGEYTAEPSRVELYYTSNTEFWVTPVTTTILP